MVTPTMRRVPTTVPNLRDVGGLTGLDGRVVRRGRVLRSALPAVDDVAPDGLPWPPAVVLDLRSPIELEGGHPLDPLGPRLVNLPLLQALRPGWQDSQTLVGLYELVLTDASDLLVELVGEVAAAEGPVLVHCAAGKDRTGIAVALLLGLLGVDRGDVVDDYLLTRHAGAAIDARLRRDEPHPPVPAPFLAVSEEAIGRTLDAWQGHDGGVEGWFGSVGGSPDDVERLRTRLLA